VATWTTDAAACSAACASWADRDESMSVMSVSVEEPPGDRISHSASFSLLPWAVCL
jgi:cobalamin biosynthesis protein CbiD